MGAAGRLLVLALGLVGAAGAPGEECLVGACYYSAAKDFGSTHASPQRSIALCKVVDGPYKADCYTAVQEFLVDFHADQARRDLKCKTADEAYQSLCRGTPRAAANQQTQKTKN